MSPYSSPYAHITGWGMSVPERVMTNQDLEKMVNTSDEWITTMTGIRQRRIASQGETTASLATEAAIQALDRANLAPDQVELIIVATSSPEHTFPATACLVQDRLGAGKAGAFDLLAACSGFIYALNMASQAIRSGSVSNALVIGSETLSRLVNWEDRNTCILFGDGAGAFVLQASQEPGGVISGIMRSDGSGGDLLSIPAGGSFLPTSAETVTNRLHYIQMDGREVFRFASRVMAQATEEVIEMANLKMEDISLVVPHQANLRIITAAARGMKVSMDKVFVNLERYGNTSTASIPIAVCEAVECGRLHPGEKVVLVGFGAGLTWGAALAEWSGPFPARRKVYPARYRAYARLRSWLLRVLRRIDAWMWGASHPNE